MASTDLQGSGINPNQQQQANQNTANSGLLGGPGSGGLQVPATSNTLETQNGTVQVAGEKVPTYQSFGAADYMLVAIILIALAAGIVSWFKD